MHKNSIQVRVYNNHRWINKERSTLIGNYLITSCYKKKVRSIGDRRREVSSGRSRGARSTPVPRGDTVPHTSLAWWRCCWILKMLPVLKALTFNKIVLVEDNIAEKNACRLHNSCSQRLNWLYVFIPIYLVLRDDLHTM